MPLAQTFLSCASVVISICALVISYRARRDSERDRLFRLRSDLVRTSKLIELSWNQVLSELYRRRTSAPARILDANKRGMVIAAYDQWEKAFQPMRESAASAAKEILSHAEQYQRLELEKHLLRLENSLRSNEASVAEMHKRLDLLER